MILWIEAEHDMGQLESLHTCPPGEMAAWPLEETASGNQQARLQSSEPSGKAAPKQPALESCGGVSVKDCWRAQAWQAAQDADDPSRLWEIH